MVIICIYHRYISYIFVICIPDAYLMTISSDISDNKPVGIFKQFRDCLVKTISFLVSINVIFAGYTLD